VPTSPSHACGLSPSPLPLKGGERLLARAARSWQIPACDLKQARVPNLTYSEVNTSDAIGP